MKPRALGPGDTVGLVSPASPLEEEKLEYVTNLLASQGLKTRLAAHALARDSHLAGSDLDRANDLQSFYADPQIDAILCTRGGYGCSRLLPYLDFDAMAASGKMLIGFSDITILHLALNRRNVPTVHGPMALTLHYPREDWVYDSFVRSLRGDLTLSPEAPKPQTLVGGIAEGPTVGGCMCLLTDSIGTTEPLETDGKILFIEDVDEAPHRIDAMFTHLRNTGILGRAAGLVIGEMTRTDERIDATIGGKGWREIVADRVSDLGIPVVIDFPFGHARAMHTVGLGLQARLDANAGTLVYLEDLCEA